MKITNSTHVSSTTPIHSIKQGARKEDPSALGAQTARSVDSTTPASNDGSHARFDAYAQKIENRLNQALDSRDLSPRQRQALESKRDEFHAMMNRLADAYGSGSNAAGAPTMAGMHKLLERFASSVNHVLAGAQPIDPQAAPAPAGEPMDHKQVDKLA